MALLEKIMFLKQQGNSDAQIVDMLMEEGITPREINEAISQSQIKSAVATDSYAQEPGLQPSIMNPSESQMIAQQEAETQENIYAQEQMPVQQEAQAYPSYPGAGYDQYAYPQQAEQTGEGYYTPPMDLETIHDIAKQEVEESMRKIKDELSSFSKFKTEIKFEMQDIESRLVKIEAVIQEVQSSIIRKMGDYGAAISGISKEIRATQESFSKVLNPLMDKRREIPSSPQSKSAKQSINSKQQANQSSQRPSEKSSGASFEEYFR